MRKNAPPVSPNLDDPYGLFDPQIFDDPYPIYHLLRYAEPVYWCETLGAWLLTCYSDVRRALADSAYSSAARRPAATGRLPEELSRRMVPIDDFISHWLMNLDAPEHGQLRLPLARLFNGINVQGLRARVIALATRLLDPILADGGGDLIETFAQPLPVAVIADLVGIPRTDHVKLFGWFNRMSTYFEFGAARIPVLQAMTETIGEMKEYLGALCELRRSLPQSDFLTEALTLEAAEDSSARDRTVATIALFLFAGHESTRASFGNGMLAILGQPEAERRLRANPGLLDHAIEEMLRYDGPFMRVDRVLTVPVEVRSRRLSAGERVVLVVGAANRDPSHFQHPDRFDIDRLNVDHLGFGHGEHYCLGARLARLELRVGFEMLLARLPERISVDGLVWRTHFNHRGLRSMELSFG
jgi:cytochrome P450